MERNTSNHDATEFSPFIVFGASKSGTTWLQRALDCHPDIRCHFQRPIFPIMGAMRSDMGLYESKVSLVVGRSPYSGVFSSPQEEEAYHYTLEYIRDLNLLHRDYLSQHVASASEGVRNELAKLHLRCVRAVIANLLHDTPGKAIVGTKAYTDLQHLFDVFPDAKVIHIVRDGRDVAVSRRFHTLRQGIYFSGEERHLPLSLINRSRIGRRISGYVFRKTGLFGPAWYREPATEPPLLAQEAIKKFAIDWRQTVQYIARFCERFPANFCVIRYEDLLAEPAEGIRRAVTFLGANAADHIISEIVRQTSFPSAAKGGFFRKGISGDWKNHFTEENQLLFEELAGPELAHYGYDAAHQ